MASTSTQHLLSVEGMVVCITGGGTGIGRMMTEAFATNGASKVYIIGRRKDRLDAAAQEINPNVIIPIVGDVTSKESLLKIADQIKEETGYLNLLCCNSGTMPPSPAVRSGAPLAEYRNACLDLQFEDWQQTFATNSTSVFFNTFVFLELLDAGNAKGNAAGRKSQVLVTTSIAGYSRLPATLGAYTASKAATTHLVKQLAGALVPYSVRVNGIAPGLFPSELAAGIISMGNATKEPTEEGAFEKSFIPAERVGRPEDMIGTVLYHASAAGAYLNGNITVLDGGRISQMPSTY